MNICAHLQYLSKDVREAFEVASALRRAALEIPGREFYTVRLMEPLQVGVPPKLDCPLAWREITVQRDWLRLNEQQLVHAILRGFK